MVLWLVVWKVREVSGAWLLPRKAAVRASATAPSMKKFRMKVRSPGRGWAGSLGSVLRYAMTSSSMRTPRMRPERSTMAMTPSLLGVAAVARCRMVLTSWAVITTVGDGGRPRKGANSRSQGGDAEVLVEGGRVGDRVGEAVAEESVAPRAAGQQIAAGAAGQDVIARAAVEDVVVRPAEELGIAGPGVDDRRPLAAVDEDVAAQLKALQASVAIEDRILGNRRVDEDLVLPRAGVDHNVGDRCRVEAGDLRAVVEHHQLIGAHVARYRNVVVERAAVDHQHRTGQDGIGCEQIPRFEHLNFQEAARLLPGSLA